MRKLILRTIAACGLALSLASVANAGCLEAIRDYGIASAFRNTCPHPVSVNWTDQGGCNGWRCSNFVAAHQIASVGKWTGEMYWCEAPYPNSAQGPC